MTNKDLLNVMQHLGVTYTDEADARAAEHAAGFGRKPLLPALTVLGSAAACIAVLAGVIHMGSMDEQMQTSRQDIAVQMEAETEPDGTTVTAVTEQTTAASQPFVQTDSAVNDAPQPDKAAAKPESETPNEPAQVHLPVQTDVRDQVSQEAQPTQTLPNLSPELSDMLADILKDLPDDISEESYEKPILTADQISGHAGETVAFSLYAEKNPGFNWFGFEMEYDAELHLRTNSEDMDDVTYQTRELPEDGVDIAFINYNDGKSARLTPVFVWDFEEWASNKPIDNYDEWYFIDGDGMLITFYFDIPADAESGTVYNMTLNPTSCITHGGKTILTWDVINGSITVL